MVQLGRVADLAEEAFEDAAAVDQVAADDLEDFHPAHERVPGEEDGAHAPLPEFSQDFIVGEVGQARRQGAGREWRRRGRGSVQHRESIRGGDDRSEGPGLGLAAAEAAKEAVGGDFGDAAPAIRAALQVREDRCSRGVVEPAEAISPQGLVGRM